MNDDQAQILEIHERWLEAEQSGNVDAMLELCTEDVRLYPSNAPVRSGKSEVREYLLTPGPAIERISVSNITVEISGTLGIKTADFRTIWKNFSTTQTESVEGSHLWVLRREKTQWRIALVTWSTWQR